MDTNPTVESVWGVVEALAMKQSSVLTWHALPYSVGAGELQAAVDMDGHFVVLVPLTHGETVPSDNTASTVQLRRQEAGGKAYVGVSCLKPDLNDVFLMFVHDLIRSLPHRGKVCDVVVDVVHRWRSLFAEAEKAAILSIPQIIGLLAELHTLENILIGDPYRDLNVWTGPGKSQHDFRTVGHALEVKATTGREGLRVRISSVEQLNSDADVSLHLDVYRYEPSPEGDSLPAAVARIQALQVEPGLLSSLLLKSGYRGQFSDVYQAYRFKTSGHYVYDVKESGFPRITPSSFVSGRLPSGTERLSYTIDLSNASTSPLSPDELGEVYVNMKGVKGA
ncbi:PD-(D/E)XK motif protein [Arthrobacter sp. D3-18]